MNILSHKILRTKTLAGNLAKQYVYFAELDGEYFIYIKKYILSDIPDRLTYHDLVRIFKGKKLTLEIFSIKLTSFKIISDWIQDILKQYGENNIHNTKS